MSFNQIYILYTHCNVHHTTVEYTAEQLNGVSSVWTCTVTHMNHEQKNTKQSLKFNKGTLTLPHSHPPPQKKTHTHTCARKQTFHWLRNELHYFPDSSLSSLHVLVRQIYSLAPEPGLSTWIVKEAAAGSSTSQNSSPLVGTTRAAGNGEASPSSNTSCK